MKKSMAVLILGLLLTTSIIATACASASESLETSPTEAPSVGVGAPAPMPPMEESGSFGKDFSGAGSSFTPESAIDERLIVRSGDMWLVVKDVPNAVDKIKLMADGLEGYVVSSRVWKERERLVGDISIRVPVEHFDDAVNTLRNMAVDVTSEQSTSKDVTEEYVDLNARLQNLEATEDQLLVIMEKAETVEEILDVQSELSKTRGEIEQTRARMQYLERTSDTSIIEIRLEQSKLDVEFFANTTRVKESDKIQFYSRVAGGFPAYSYQWDLGDGTITTEEIPVHSYKDDDSYTVSLTVTDDRGNTETEIRTGYITVLPGWSPGNIASGAWNGLIVFGRVMLNIIIWVGIFSPVWIVIGGITYLIVRWQRKQTKEAKQAEK